MPAPTPVAFEFVRRRASIIRARGLCDDAVEVPVTLYASKPAALGCWVLLAVHAGMRCDYGYTVISSRGWGHAHLARALACAGGTSSAFNPVWWSPIGRSAICAMRFCPQPLLCHARDVMHKNISRSSRSDGHTVLGRDISHERQGLQPVSVSSLGPVYRPPSADRGTVQQAPTPYILTATHGGAGSSSHRACSTSFREVGAHLMRYNDEDYTLKAAWREQALANSVRSWSLP
jgi:hypothetical protein